MTRRAGLVAAGLCAALVLPACGGSAHGGPRLGIAERDFRIALARTTVEAGPVELQIANRGPVEHELLVIRDDGRPLPLRASGLSLDEDRLGGRLLVNVEAQAAGSHTDVALDLARGRYVLVCNMAGHYQSGMHAELVVG
jgi:uncharacterized cupredoxin-like copper-binding protein